MTAQEPQYGGTLIYADRLDVTSIDPQVSNEIPIIYAFSEGLTSLGDNGEIKPFLASEWEASENATTYTFTIRDGVMFHNGRQMVGEDVVWAVERTINPDTAAFRGNSLAGVSVELVDDMTVRLTSPTPNAALPALLASTFIIAPESANEDGSITEPIGTGPFMIEEWIPGQEMRLVRHENYWREELPYLDGLTYQIIADPTAALNALRSDTIDLSPINATDLPLALQDDSLVVEPAVLNIYGHFTFNLNQPQPPLDDVRVRRAIAIALNKSDLLTITVGEDGPGNINNQMYDEGDFWRMDVEDNFVEGDLDAARALLEEAGVADGFETSILTWADGRPAAEVLQATLAQLNITAEIIFATDFPTYRDTLLGYEYGILLDSAFPREDPSAYMTLWECDDPSNFFRAGHCNPEVDAFLETGLSISDPDARRDAYASALDILYNQEVVSVIYLTRKQIWGIQDGVTGFSVGTGKLNRVDGGIAETWLSE
ncbi:MAG: ABC transporter substrate-binding protein [Chloroflexota bacterium]